MIKSLSAKIILGLFCIGAGAIDLTGAMDWSDLTGMNQAADTGFTRSVNVLGDIGGRLLRVRHKEEVKKCFKRGPWRNCKALCDNVGQLEQCVQRSARLGCTRFLEGKNKWQKRKFLKKVVKRVERHCDSDLSDPFSWARCGTRGRLFTWCKHSWREFDTWPNDCH